MINALSALDGISANHDEQLGVDIVRKAITAPIRSIAENAGQNGALIAEEAKEQKGNVGYNALTDTWEDLVKAGVIDPAKVTRMAIQNAASISGLSLTIETMVAELPKDDVENAVEGSVT